MQILSTILVVLVALEHLYILYMEMFAWETLGKKTFNPNSAIEKKEYFSILISNCVAVEKNKR